MKIKEPISLGQLAKELDINKSKLNYYTWIGLLKPVEVMGRTFIFEKKEVLKKLKEIEKSKLKGRQLKSLVK